MPTFMIEQRPKVVRRRIIALAAMMVVGAVGAAAALAPRADADSTDVAFLAALDSKPITYPDAGYAIRAAWTICDQLDTGISAPVLVSTLAQVSYLNVGEAGYFVGASIAAYCPRHAAQAVAA